jgi:UDP-glucose 4-epimerase
MKTVLVTGSQGFIGSYVCQELLRHDYAVIGLDNYSKYGEVARPQNFHDNFRLIEGDAKRIDTRFALQDMKQDEELDCIINCAAMIGGISYFHEYAYDLLAENERICASIFDFAIGLFKKGLLRRIVQMSSSMVFECATKYPTPEGHELECPPPHSSYGFQKLATEYYCRAACSQHGLPYTIIRPFNCVGAGEDAALGEKARAIGNVKMMMSHVLPDVIHRAIQLGPSVPFPILGKGEQTRCYTNGKNIARAIRIAMESEKAEREDFNISTPVSTTVLELVDEVFCQLYNEKPAVIESQEPFEHDVQTRIPDVSKAKSVLGISCDTTLRQSVAEVISYMKGKSK